MASVPEPVAIRGDRACPVPEIFTGMLSQPVPGTKLLATTCHANASLTYCGHTAKAFPLPSRETSGGRATPLPDRTAPPMTTAVPQPVPTRYRLAQMATGYPPPV